MPTGIPLHNVPTMYGLEEFGYVGGMPEAVDYFREHKDYIEVRNIQKSLLLQYEDDFVGTLCAYRRGIDSL